MSADADSDADSLMVLERIEALEMQNARLMEENDELNRLLVRAWEWVGVKPPGGIRGLPRRYRDMLKVYSRVVGKWKSENPGVEI